MRRHIHTDTNSETALCAILPFGDMRSEVLSCGILAYLGWMRLWLSCLTESFTANMSLRCERGLGYLRAFELKALQEAADIASGKTRAPALIPETARAAEAPKIMLGRRAKRILARGLPASRRYDWFRFASPRTLSGNQFFELLGRLSGNGRAVIYRLEYKMRLCTRRPKTIILGQNLSFLNSTSLMLRSLNFGLCAAHLWPN